MNIKVSIPSTEGVLLTSSIAIKPRTTRAKNLILRGAKGQDARHDNCQHGRHHQGESYNCMRPMLSTRDLIAESLEGGLPSQDQATSRKHRDSGLRLARTSQSIGYAYRPAERQSVSARTLRHHREVVEASQPQFDSVGRPIVYVSERCINVWNQRPRR